MSTIRNCVWSTNIVKTFPKLAGNSPFRSKDVNPCNNLSRAWIPWQSIANHWDKMRTANEDQATNNCWSCIFKHMFTTMTQHTMVVGHNMSVRIPHNTRTISFRNLNYVYHINHEALYIWTPERNKEHWTPIVSHTSTRPVMLSWGRNVTSKMLTTE